MPMRSHSWNLRSKPRTRSDHNKTHALSSIAHWHGSTASTYLKRKKRPDLADRDLIALIANSNARGCSGRVRRNRLRHLQSDIIDLFISRPTDQIPFLSWFFLFARLEVGVVSGP